MAEKARLLEEGRPLAPQGGDVQYADEGKPLVVRDMSNFNSAIALVNTVVGSGILGLPFAMHQASLAPGVGCMMLAMLLSGYSMSLLAKCCLRTRSDSYKDVLMKAFGTNWGLGIEAMVVGYTFMSCIAYSVIWADNFPEVLKNDWHVADPWNSKWILMAFVGCLFTALCCLPRLSMLRYSSVLGTGFALFLGFMLAYKYFTKAECPQSETPVCEHVNYVKFSLDLFKALPLFAVAFNGHFNIFPVYQQMERPQDVNTMIYVVMSGIAALYCLSAVTGYLTFGPSTESDILSSYKTADWMVITAKLGICFTVTGAFALNMYATKMSLVTIWTHFHPRFQMQQWKNVVMSFVLVPSAVLIALVTPSKGGLGIVLDYQGALFGSIIVFVAPGAAWYRFSESSAERVMAIVLLVVGIASGILGCVMTTLNVAQGKS
eukprot:NODE_2435_length_1422_cov_60.253272_g2317_i0.p1 GENE.NODE_2435_length_1422_cov_60.253272_g2317_i0~~NODE_2435_length_1422_cov_60.253272_g2317_i0.p1  ORF type:complete len:433 (+),score=31.51 NODE_2435_length_1422_cov_60.253272_g2317_i0:50-1348(+)